MRAEISSAGTETKIVDSGDSRSPTTWAPSVGDLPLTPKATNAVKHNTQTNPLVRGLERAPIPRRSICRAATAAPLATVPTVTVAVTAAVAATVAVANAAAADDDTDTPGCACGVGVPLQC